MIVRTQTREELARLRLKAAEAQVQRIEKELAGKDKARDGSNSAISLDHQARKQHLPTRSASIGGGFAGLSQITKKRKARTDGKTAGVIPAQIPPPVPEDNLDRSDVQAFITSGNLHPFQQQRRPYSFDRHNRQIVPSTSSPFKSDFEQSPRVESASTTSLNNSNPPVDQPDYPVYCSASETEAIEIVDWSKRSPGSYHYQRRGSNSINQPSPSFTSSSLSKPSPQPNPNNHPYLVPANSVSQTTTTTEEGSLRSDPSASASETDLRVLPGKGPDWQYRGPLPYTSSGATPRPHGGDPTSLLASKSRPRTTPTSNGHSSFRPSDHIPPSFGGTTEARGLSGIDTTMLDDVKAFKLLLDQTSTMVTFLKKRVEIEELYADQLQKLMAKQEEADINLDAEGLRLFPSTLRKAWKELRDSTQREAEVHRAWVTACLNNVIIPLNSFKDTKERIRKRCRDDVREAAHAHEEYKGVVNRLQRSYHRKCTEVQEHAATEAAVQGGVAPQPAPVRWPESPPNGEQDYYPTSTSATEEYPSFQHSASNQRSGSPNSPSQSNQAFVSGATSAHLRESAISPPTSTTPGKAVLQATRATKHQVNSLLNRVHTRIGTRGGDEELGGPGEAMRLAAVRGVKLRSEAEVLDMQYRSGVYYLETLRLQRERVSKSAAASLTECALDLSSKAKDLFMEYENNLSFLFSNRGRDIERVVLAVQDINPEQDTINFERVIDTPANAEPSILYNSFFVGPCASLIFGISLADYHNKTGNTVPKLVSKCIEAIDERGLSAEGIYRVNGNAGNIQQLTHDIEKDENAFNFDANKHDPFTIASLLKLYLRQLPMALFPMPLSERAALSNAFESDPEGTHLSLMRRIRRLDTANQATLRVVIQHLTRVAEHQEENKMGYSNLNTIFNAVICGEAGPGSGDMAMLGPEAWKQDRVVEILMRGQDDIFISEAKTGQAVYTAPPPPPDAIPPPPPTTTDSMARLKEYISQASFDSEGAGPPLPRRPSTGGSQRPRPTSFQRLSLQSPPLTPPLSKDPADPLP